jgi:hypothetical protein
MLAALLGTALIVIGPATVWPAVIPVREIEPVEVGGDDVDPAARAEV